MVPVWPDWAIFCTLGNFFKPLATIYLPKSLTFLGNFCKVIKIYHFSCEIIFGQLLQMFGDFYLVTLIATSILFYLNWIRMMVKAITKLTIIAFCSLTSERNLLPKCFISWIWGHTIFNFVNPVLDRLDHH